MSPSFFSGIARNFFYLPEPRNFKPPHFLDKELEGFYRKNGYAVARQVVSNEAIGIIEDTYHSLYKRKDFFEAGGFITSPNYGAEAQQFVMDRLKEANSHILPRLFDMSRCMHDFFSLLVIKFNQDGTYVEPHQDIAMVDEYSGASTYLWIPTATIDNKNGAILVLPGSHLWATWQKTHNRDITPLKKNSRWLLEQMVPVYMNKGDLLVFDASLIHASQPNTSDQVRIAMNTSVIAKGEQMVHYEIHPGTPKGMVEKYHIDTSFWNKMSYLNPISGKQTPYCVEPMKCPIQLNRINLRYLINKYAP